MLNQGFKILILFLFNIIFQQVSYSQSVPFVTNNCNICELNNLYQHNDFIEFEGGNICCDRNYQLVFSDEFNGTSLDTTKWFTYYHPPSSGNPDHTNRVHENRGSYFKDENVIVGGGICTLRTKIETVSFPRVTFPSGKVFEDRKFTSGMLWSKSIFENLHRYEIRCNSPKDAFKKMWTSFWIFGWATEVDFFEFIGKKYPEFSVHKWSDPKYSITSGEYEDLGSLVGKFHTYAVEHDKYFIRFYIDSHLVYTVSLFKELNNNHSFNDCYLDYGIYRKEMSYPDCNEPALSVIVDPGTTPSASNRQTDSDDSDFPNDFLIDYIRVYKNVSNEEPNSCKGFKIIGPNTTCKEIDTLEFCLSYGIIDTSLLKLPKGMKMFQYPSLSISEKTIKVNGLDSIVLDTVVKENCIKVITDLFWGGTIEYLGVPEECRFLLGSKITKHVGLLIPTPVTKYELYGCNLKICIDNVEPYDDILWSENAVRVDSNCWYIEDLKFGTKPPYDKETFIFLQVANKCGKRLFPIKINNTACGNSKLNDNDLDTDRLKIQPNPASNYFYIIDANEESEEYFIDGFILSINNFTINESLKFNYSRELLINSSHLNSGEYLIVVRDSNNKFYKKTIIINNN